MTAIELDRATIRIRNRTVLSDLTISIRAGEFIGVLGPNGSG
jgi:ABC-type Mn2+/Zn2+ transport system ATPase subunit